MSCGNPTSWVRLLGLLAAGLALGCDGLAEALWRIGTRDESSVEFSHWRDRSTGERRLNYADPAQDPVFRVGVSEPSRDWFAFQPGDANGAAGYREHPFTIEFGLPRTPEAGCRLTLHLLAYSARLPLLQVEVNGARGWYFQRPELTYTAGDTAAFFLPHYSRSTVVVDLAPGLIRSGTNRLVLTALDDPPVRDDGQPSGFTWPGVSGIVYDCLQLESFPPGPKPPSFSPQVRLTPTIFYKRDGDRLQELVEVVVGMPVWPASGSVTLEVGGISHAEAFPAERTHGEARWLIRIPEFASNTMASVTVEADGIAHRSSATLTPARRWNLLLVPNQHLDIGYTDHPAKISELHSRAVDRVLELSQVNPGFRFTVDGYWVIEQFLRGRSSERAEALVDSVRRGIIEVPAVYASHFTGFSSLENLVRSLYPARQFSRTHGLPFEMALSTDVPSHSWSWASVLDAAGIRYFVAASDAYRAPFLLENRLHERSPFQWEGPDGARVWTWYSRHYHQGASLFGAPPAIECAVESLPRFLQAYDHPEYRSDTVILYGTQVENVAVDPDQASFAERWNRQFAFPRLEYSGFAKAMERVTQDFPQPTVVRGDGGPYWEDGLAANARITALARGTMRRALSAETFSTVASLAAPGFEPDSTVARRLWENLLLTDEHTWHADVSVSDPDSQQSRLQGALKDSRALDAAKDADHLLARALGAIADRIPNPSRTLVVFNSLSWERDGWVETDLPKGTQPVDLTTGERVPVQRLQTGNGFQRVRFLARAVPSVGYRCYALRPQPQAPPEPIPQDSPILENEHYRLVLDPVTGSIRSWVDRASGRELVDSSHAYRLNQHLYVTGADTLPNRLVQYSTVSPLPELTVHAASGGRLLDVVRYPFGVVARMECTNLNHPRLETTVILHAHEKKVEIVNLVEKNMVRTKEAAYFAFPFNLRSPRFRYATQNGFVDPSLDLLPGACREWQCVQEWLDIAAEGAEVLLTPVDAPLATIGDIARGSWPREWGHRPGTVYSYLMSNYTPEGYQAGQSGSFTFRYLLTTTSSFDSAAAHRFGAEALTPLEINEITRNDKIGAPQGTWSPDRGSFLNVAPDHLSLVTWKRAEDGDGTILRLVETGGKTGPCRVTSPLLSSGLVERCTAVEDPLPGSSDTTIGPFRIATFRAR